MSVDKWGSPHRFIHRRVGHRPTGWRPFGFGAFDERANLPLKVTGVVKVLVDAGKTNVSDFVHRTEPLQDRPANLLARHAVALPAKCFFDLGNNFLQRRIIDRAVLARRSQAGLDLDSVERLGVPASFDHQQRHPFDTLEGGVPAFTFRTLPTAPDCRAVLGVAGLDDAVII